MKRLLLIALLSGAAVLVGRGSMPGDMQTRARDLEEVVAGLQQRPLGDSQVKELTLHLRLIAHHAPGDEAGIRASYLLGRLQQLSGNEDSIPPEFASLLADFPEHPLAQLARMKVILYRLYGKAPRDASERLREAESLGQGLRLPGLLCDFHLAMGDAYLFFGDQREAALRHLLAAESGGITNSATLATVLVQIGELARLTGKQACAREAYQKYLTNFPHDARVPIVRARLATVEEGGQP